MKYESKRDLRKRISDLESDLEYMKYTREHTGLVCKTHWRSAARQQVPGGEYRWMWYCDYTVRLECEMMVVP